MNNCIYFSLRPGQEQQDLCWGDLELKTNADGLRYGKLSTERQTKRRTGENTRNVREGKPKMYENLDNNDCCPVTTYLAYKQHRPPEMMADDSQFYLTVNTEVLKAGKKWFKAAPLGVNSLRSMVKNMVAASQVHSDKKLVNHSTRKHLVQNLVDNNIPLNEIVQITGHKNINSLNNYSRYIWQTTAAHLYHIIQERGIFYFRCYFIFAKSNSRWNFIHIYSSTQHKCRNFALSLPVPGRNSEHFHKFPESKRQRFWENPLV